MPYRSSIPAAIPAIVAAWKTWPALGLAGVPVLDGPDASQGQRTEAVAVGYTGDQNESVAGGSASPEGLAVLPDRERYAVTCCIEAYDPAGGTDITAARTRAYDLHAACGQAIAADHTLGKTVLRASLGIGSLQQQQTTNGALARIVFPVNIDAFTSR
jgi:hypothetical protein